MDRANVFVAIHHSRDMDPQLLTPTKDHHFTFGLWTVGNVGRDPFGDPTRPGFPPEYTLERLSKLGAYGVNLHDNDLIPFGTSESEGKAIASRFKEACESTDMKVPGGCANLFSHPVFKDGAFTSNKSEVRAFAVQKCLHAMDLMSYLGGEYYILWGGREGAEVDGSKDLQQSIKWYRECINYLCEYNIDQGLGLKLAMEGKPNEPRGDIFLPTTGAILAFIETLDHPDMVGVNPEVAHEQMAGLNFSHAVAQALEVGKLFHIDLNAQKPGRFDQDLRFGSEDLKGAFYLVKLLEDSGYDGMLHIDAHAYRTEDAEGVWDFAAGNMRTYLILKEKVKQFNSDAEIRSLMAEITECSADMTTLLSSKYEKESAAGLKTMDLKPEELAKVRLPYERLDQIVVDILTGVR